MKISLATLATIDDADEILKWQQRAYQSEAERYGNYDIPPLTQTLEDIQSQFETHIFLSCIRWQHNRYGPRAKKTALDISAGWPSAPTAKIGASVQHSLKPSRLVSSLNDSSFLRDQKATMTYISIKSLDTLSIRLMIMSAETFRVLIWGRGDISVQEHQDAV